MEEFDHVSLKVPNYDLRLVGARSFPICMLLVGGFTALLELVRDRDRWVFNLRHHVLAALIRSLIKMLLTRDKTAALSHITNAGWV